MSKIKIYQVDGNTEISVTIEQETVWLNLNQIVELFDRDKSVISRHITNIFREEELDRGSVVAKNATTASDGKTYLVDYYNLDVIISVGYRVKSKQGTQFRIWANKVLREYLLQGYTVNQKALEKKNEKLKGLQETVRIIRNSISAKELTDVETTGLLDIIADYSYALDILDQYDYQTLKITDTTTGEIYRLTYQEAIHQIKKARKVHGNSELFGR
jgi:hypothetical protein